MKRIHENVSYQQRQAKNHYRNRIDLLRSRVCMLTGKDRVVMTMYLKNGNSFRQMAQVIGVNEANISRKIHKLTKRLLTGKYIVCLRNRKNFTDHQMEIAKDSFVNGMAMKKIAKKQDCSYYRIRQTLKEIQELLNDIEAQNERF